MGYAAEHLDPLRVPSGDRPAVVATFRWHEGSPPRNRLNAHPELGTLERVDRDLYRSEGRLAWFRVDDVPALHLRFRWDGIELRVDGDFFYRLSADPRRDQLKRLVFHRRLEALRRRRFTTLLYYLLYYPCFWWLERQRDAHPLHAAGVELTEGVVILGGASGVGKSTLAAGLALSPGARMLSDTFLLHRGSAVWPVREPLLLDRRSQEWLGADAAWLRPIKWRYCLNRAGFHWPADRLSVGGNARLLVFPQRAARTSLRAIAPAQAHGRMSAGDLIVNDLRRYWAYAAVLEMLDPSPLGFARERSLATLVGEVPSYEIGLTPGVERNQIVTMIAGLCGGDRPRSESSAGAGAISL